MRLCASLKPRRLLWDERTLSRLVGKASGACGTELLCLEEMM